MMVINLIRVRNDINIAKTVGKFLWLTVFHILLSLQKLAGIQHAAKASLKKVLNVSRVAPRSAFINYAYL